MRNVRGLNEQEIKSCERIWAAIGGLDLCRLDVTNADTHGSRTRYNELQRLVLLGADVKANVAEMPAAPARDRMSIVAVLAHELAHARRHNLGFDRPIVGPDKLIDEAETSLEASFNPNLDWRDRQVLVEDARDQLNHRLEQPFEEAA